MLLYARLAAPGITLVCGALFTEPFGPDPHAAFAAPAVGSPAAFCIDRITAITTESPRDAAGGARSGVEDANWPVSHASGNPDDPADDAQPSSPMRVVTPEAGPWPSVLWPTPDDDKRSEAVDALRAATLDMVRDSGAVLPIMDTEYFIVTTDLGRDRTAEWLPRLDDGFRGMLQFLGLSADDPPPPGRIALIVLADRDRFGMMQARTFDQSVPHSVHSVMQARDQQTFVFVHAEGDDSLDLADMLDRIHIGTARALLHLYLSPLRLPLWANEGVAELLCTAAETGSARAHNVRSLGVAAMRAASPRDLGFLFSLTYADEPWPDARTPALTAGSVITWLMHQDRRQAFLAWIRAIKLGTAWEDALRTSFGTDPATLLDTSQRFFRVNN